MELYFLRHAKAAPRRVRGRGPDSERPLTPEGEEKLRSVVAGIKRLGLSFDLILSSPYLRARRTAEIAAELLNASRKLRLSATLTPEAEPAALLRELNQLRATVGTVLLVGHEPAFSQLISILVAGHPDARLEIKKASLCKVTANVLRRGRCATLEFLLSPRQLILLGEK